MAAGAYCTISLLFSVLFAAVLGQDIRFLGQTNVRQAGFSTIFQHEDVSDPTEAFSVIISTFSPVPNTKDDVVFLRYPGKYLDDPESAEVVTLGTQFEWPREPRQVPKSVFGTNNIIAQPCGFIPPGKNNGSVILIDMDDPEAIINTDVTYLSEGDINSDELWFYHRTIWLDADGDGLEDMFTCRARQEPFPETYFSEFHWYKNPGGDSPQNTGPWDFGKSFTKDTCDTMMTPVNLTVGDRTYTAIFTVGYFFGKLSVFWTEDPEGRWDDPLTFNDRVISTLTDDTECEGEEGVMCGHFFDVWVEDMDLDGRLDLVVSVNSEVYGSLQVFEIPDDFRTDDYVRHHIVGGFFPRSGLQGGGSPGMVKTFHPLVDMIGETRPWIVLSGDDDGRSYYLEPLDESPGTWDYNMTEFSDQGPGTIVGTPSSFDSDGDGYTELFVPCWSDGLVKFYTFAP